MSFGQPVAATPRIEMLRMKSLWPAALVVGLASGGLAWGQSTLYVSPTGNDAADGLTPATAWRSVEKVSATAFQPGQTVLFERGGEWRGRLSASSSGTAAAPIVYGAYGDGAKPRFYGSDILNKAGFVGVGGGSMAGEIGAPLEVGSVLADGQFLRSSAAVTRSADSAVNRAHVLANPGFWWRDDAASKLIVNTGGSIAADPRRITAVTRDDVVFNNYRSHLVFRDLAADETAFYDRGYAFRVQGGLNVRVENSDAFRAGKHHFGVINSSEFVGKGLYAAIAMPDQGEGGATALVSYSDNRYTGHTSAWQDVVVENMGGNNYPAWYSHGEGIGAITLDNIVSRGVSLSINERTVARNVTVENGSIVMYAGSLDGATLKGTGASLTLWGNSVARNVLIDRFKYASGYVSPVVVFGPNTTLELSTVTQDPTNPGFASMISFANSQATLNLRGSIFSGPFGMNLSNSLVNLAQLTGNYNLFSAISFTIPGMPGSHTLAQWAALTGRDLNSLMGTPGFIDALAGNYNLLPGSIGIDAIPAGLYPNVLLDRNGRQRLVGSGYDIGAFEGFTVIPEPGAAVWMGVALAGLAMRRRRRTE